MREVHVSLKRSGTKMTSQLAVLVLSVAAAASAQVVPRPAIVGISHVTLRAADLGKSRHFYGGVLGLREEPASDAQHARFRINHRQFIELVAAGPDAPADRLVQVGFE